MTGRDAAVRRVCLHAGDDVDVDERRRVALERQSREDQDDQRERAALEDLLARWCDDGSALSPIARHVLAVPGKRVRGRLTLACAQLGDQTAVAASTADEHARDALRAAAAVELLHEASLVHDDICDRSLLRRGAASVAAAFGIRTAARFGLWLAARSLALIGELEARRHLGLAFAPLTALAEGQLLETVRCGDGVAERREHYLAVVRAKTGALMRMACDVGGRLAGLVARDLDALAMFADAFGTAFQVHDDIRDLEAPSSLGKPGGSDLARGLWTWPVLEWLGDRPDTAARALAAQPLEVLRAELASSGALARTRAFADAEIARAHLALRSLPDTPGRAWLVELLEASS
jgi:geranylgeranyl pyrophosphate synthase